MGSMEISATFQRIILTQLLNAYGGKHVSELLGPNEDGDAGPKGLRWELDPLSGPDWGQRTTYFERKEHQRNSLVFGLIPGMM